MRWGGGSSRCGRVAGADRDRRRGEVPMERSTARGRASRAPPETVARRAADAAADHAGAGSAAARIRLLTSAPRERIP
jgi:hypothetical protein